MTELKPVVRTDMEEQETSITFSRTEDIAYLYTSDNTIITKVNKLLKDPETEWKLENTNYDKEGNPTGYELSFPKKLITYRAKKQPGREFTDEEREELRAKMAEVRAAQNNSNS